MTNQEFIESIRLEGEEWRDVVGFKGYYMVSSFGRVATLYREYIREDGAHHHTEQRILNGWLRKYPGGVTYLIFTLRKKSPKKHYACHRLVAEAFLQNPNNYPNVDHIDTNGLNNRVENLRWCTQFMNIHNPLSRQKSQKASDARKGVPNIPNSISVVQLKDGKLVHIFTSMAECGRTGFAHSAICRCCRGQKPQYKGYTWMYLSDYEKLVNKSKNSV